MKTIKNKQLLVLIILFLFSLSIKAQDTFILRSALNNSLVLSIENNSNGIRANAQVKTYSRKRTQQWVVVRSNERNFFYLRSKASDYVLDIKNGSSSIRTSVWMYALNKGSAQKWQKIPAGNGYFYLKSKLGTYLDIKGGSNRNGTSVWTYVLNRSDAQKWKFDPVDQSLRIPTNCTLNNCTEINRSVLGIVHVDRQYVVYSQSGNHFYAPTYDEAKKIKDILFEYYDMDKYCSLDNIIFPFRRDVIISGRASGEKCGPSFDPINLVVFKRRSGRWQINDAAGRAVMVTTSKNKALKMICLIQKMGLKKICVFGNASPAGSGNPPVIGYLRK